MVTRAAKDLLRNTIRSTGYHNRLLEEEEMWRQWEVEKGLTMMVTDDYIRRRMRMDEYPGPSGQGSTQNKPEFSMKELQKQKQAARESYKEPGNYWNRKLMEIEEKDPDRWGHSGYKELYPEEFNETRQNSNKVEKHGKAKKHKKHKKHKRLKKKPRQASSNDEAIPKVARRRDKTKGLPLTPRSSSSSDSSEEPRHRISSLYMDHEQRYKRPVSQSGLSSASSSSSEWVRSEAKAATRSRINNRSEDSSYSPYKCESDASDTSLEKRREYLKRKLEEFSEDSSSDCVVIQYSDCESDAKPSLHNISKTRPKCLNGKVLQNWRHRRKLKSQIVNGNCGHNTIHYSDTSDST